MSYGWLKGNPHVPMSWQGGGPAGGGLLYDYGAPSGSGGDGSSTGVTAQWLFDEASGNIVDEVAGLTLTASGAGPSTPYQTYSQTQSDYSANLNPGIFNKSIIGTNGGFINASDTSLALGTDSAVLEWVASYGAAATMSSATGTVFYTCDNSVNNGIYIRYVNLTTTPAFSYWLRATDGTLLQGNIALTASIFNTGTHKHRLVMDRAGNLDYLVDGASQGTVSMATLAGKNIPASQVIIGAATSSITNGLNATYYELRLTIGNTTNNSGGPGGG